MPRIEDDAFVLKTLPLGESDLLVNLLSRDHGQVRAVAKAARKSRRRFGGALEPMTCVLARWTPSASEGSLGRLEDLDVRRSHARMQADPEIQAACAILAEATLALVREEQAEPRWYRLLGAVLDALEEGLAAWPAVRYFEYWALRLHGELPDLDQCAACGAGLQPGGVRKVHAARGIVCDACLREAQGPAVALGEPERAFLAVAARKPPAEVGPWERRAEPGGALGMLLQGALERAAERRLRTYRHLETLRRHHRAAEGTRA